MKRLIGILIFSAILFNTCFSQTWQQMSSLPGFGRFVSTSFSINDKAYIGLGQINDGLYVYDFWEYDFQTNYWTRKADYPGRGSYAATAFSINGKGYVCLGADNSINSQYDLWEYDPMNNTWVQKASFPGKERYGASCFVIGNSAFVGTGSYNNANDYLYDFWMYTPATNSWTRKADFPGGKRNHAVAFSISGYGYMGNGAFFTSSGTNDFWKYDPIIDVWTRISDLPGPERCASIGFAINGKGYVGTGCVTCPINSNDFFEYDPVSDMWSPYLPASKAVKRRYATSFSIGNTGFMGLGYSDTGTLNDLWALRLIDEATINNVTDATETEGSNLCHRVTLSKSTYEDQYFSLTVKNITATANIDYISLPTFTQGVTYDSTTLKIKVPKGVSTFEIIITSLNDFVEENSETYNLTVGPLTACGTIIDDDTVSVMSITNASETEGLDLIHTITMSGLAENQKAFGFNITDISATSGIDYFPTPRFSQGVTYEPKTGIIVIPAGVANFTVTLSSIDDTINEDNETYQIHIGEQKATATIQDDDTVVKSIPDLILYPNPVRDFLFVETTEIGSTVYIVDLNGKLLRKITIMKAKTKYDLTDFAIGVYIFRFVSGSSVKNRKVIKS